MRLVQVPGTGMTVSQLVLGTMNIGDTVDRDTAARMLDTAAEAGVTMLDTANGYAGGRCETILGELLRERRGRFLVASKAGFAARLRAGVPTIGYWVVCDNPIGTERIARAGYDYVCLDAQHGLPEYRGLLTALTAIDAAGGAAGLVRVQANDAFWIGQSLDAGARGVIVPMVDTAADAQAAVAACRYPPVGRRSYGPMRAGLRVGPTPAEADREVACLAMIETAAGLRNVADIAAVPGLDGLYIGPSDLRIALGGATSTDPAVDAEFDAALATVLDAAKTAGIAAGIHCPDGATAARRLAMGFSYVSVASDLVHLEQTVRAHLDAARTTR